MKKNTFLFILSLFSSLQFCFSQTVLPLTDNMSFTVSQQGVTIEKISDTVVINDNMETFENKSYVLKGVNSSFDFHLLKNQVENKLSLLNVKSDDLISQNIKSNNEHYDTLYFCFDTVYGYFTHPILYVSRTVNNNGVGIPSWLNDTVGRYIGVHDTLDFVVIMAKLDDFYIVFQYDYVFNHTDTIYFSSSQAPHPIVLDPVDENGISINTLEGLPLSKFSITIGLPSGGDFVSDWGIPVDYGIHSSDYYYGKEKLFFGSKLECTYQGSFPSYLIEYPILPSITDSVYFLNLSDSIVNIVTNFSFYKERDYNKIGIADLIKFISYTGHFSQYGFVSYRQDYPYPYWEGSVHLSMQNSTDMSYCFQHYINYIKDDVSYSYIASPDYDEYNDSASNYYFFTPFADEHYFNNYDTLFFGKGLAYYWNVWQNSYDMVHVVADNMGMWGNWIYHDNKTDTFILEDSTGNAIASGSDRVIKEYVLPDGKYTLIQNNRFTHFNGIVGATKITSQMDFSNTDHTPPIVNNIYFINDNNNMKYQFGAFEQVILRFTATDFTTYNTNHTGGGFLQIPDSVTKVFIKQHNANEWLDVQWVKIYGDSLIGSQYESDLTSYLDNDSAIYDLKINVEDYAGNSSEYLFRPAFVYGDFAVDISENNIKNQDVQLTFSPNPVNNKLNICNFTGSGYYYYIYSLDGKLIKEGEFSDSSIEVTLLSRGVYIVVLKNSKNIVANGKFIKR